MVNHGNLIKMNTHKMRSGIQATIATIHCIQNIASSFEVSQMMSY